MPALNFQDQGGRIPYKSLGIKFLKIISQSFFGLPMGKILEGSLPSEFRRSNFQRLGWRTFYRWLGNAIPVMRGATAPQFRPNFGLISNSPGTIGNDRKIFGSIQFKPTTATDDLYPGPFIAKCLGFGPYCWNTSNQEIFFSAAVGHQLASPLTPIMPSESVTSLRSVTDSKYNDDDNNNGFV